MNNKIPNLYNVIPILKNRLILHLAFWSTVITVIVIVPGLPLTFYTYLQIVLIDILQLVFLTYGITIILVPLFFYRGRYILYFTLGIAYCLFMSWVSHLISISFFLDLIKQFTDPKNIYWTDSLTIYILFFFMVSALKLVKDLMLQQYEADQEQKQKMVQELSFLRSQLSPHFLLNTMNNLYGLSVAKSDDLPKLMLRFSDLLRYTIYDTKSEFVAVRSELKYLSDFVELSKMRLSSQVQVKFDIPEVDCNRGILPMVLVVFVENAFKHSQDLQDVINRFINIKIWIDGDYLCYQSENNCGSSSYINDELRNHLDTFKIMKEGIGLETTMRRLELIYGRDHLPTVRHESGTYSVNLRLKLNKLNE